MDYYRYFRTSTSQPRRSARKGWDGGTKQCPKTPPRHRASTKQGQRRGVQGDAATDGAATMQPCTMKHPPLQTLPFEPALQCVAAPHTEHRAAMSIPGAFPCVWPPISHPRPPAPIHLLTSTASCSHPPAPV